ncbi:hypothetical protein EJ04DRAFT_562865 [Polyplosphaeria fusca]|uniref:F-box domain-containing protein n=1 Tax=Polyplosphaeria fusca TaxID=682080 RepID=A0A9P4V132_9PLEO|nr:hypothetical protein EJ04DRAFT_562865 [Polyplosphaeria fusca]
MAAPNLDTLPTELLVHISSYLEPSSVACLALVTRRLYIDILHAPFQNLLTHNPKEHFALLHLLAKTRPDLEHCKLCHSLHSLPNLGLPTPSTPSPQNPTLVLIPSPKSDICPVPTHHENEAQSPRFFHLHRHTLYPPLLRSHRAPSTLLNRGTCLSRFSSTSRSILSFLATKHSESPFTATITYSTAARINKATLFFTLATTHKFILSTSLSAGATPFKNLERVLGGAELECCVHCARGGVAGEVRCKLGQTVRGEKGCGCVLRGRGHRCGEHGHAEECVCSVDVEVRVVGARGVEVRVWRGWEHGIGGLEGGGGLGCDGDVGSAEFVIERGGDGNWDGWDGYYAGDLKRDFERRRGVGVVGDDQVVVLERFVAGMGF